jgi:hypothetical protein
MKASDHFSQSHFKESEAHYIVTGINLQERMFIFRIDPMQEKFVAPFFHHIFNLVFFLLFGL